MFAHLLLLRAFAQIYPFEKADSPDPKQLHVLYTFFVYSDDVYSQRAVVQFNDFKLTGSPKDSTQVSQNATTGLQLALVEHGEFWNGIDPKSFCCSEVIPDECAKLNTLTFRARSKRTMHPQISVDVTQKPATLKTGLPNSGVYQLVLSNCGSTADMQFSGVVSVKSSYGFLPGVELPKKNLYLVLSILYMIIAAFWVITSIRWRKQLFSVHHYILAVIALGLMECITRFWYFADWNTTGYRNRPLFISLICFSVLKNVFANIVVLLASLGFGVTKESLGKNTWLGIKVLGFLCAVFDIVYNLVLSFRHSHSFSYVFVLLCILPGAIINGGIFCWIFSALAALIKSLKERKQVEKLALFQTLWQVLIVAVISTTTAKLYHTFSVSRSIAYKWENQWLFTDGVSSVVFVIALAVVCYLWKPNENSHRFAYSSQLANCENDGDVEPFDIEDDGQWSADVLGLPEKSRLSSSDSGGEMELANFAEDAVDSS